MRIAAEHCCARRTEGGREMERVGWKDGVLRRVDSIVRMVKGGDVMVDGEGSAG